MKLAKQHLTKKQGVEGGQALRRAQHLTNPSEEKRTVRDANTVNSLTIIIDNRTRIYRINAEYPPLAYKDTIGVDTALA